MSVLFSSESVCEGHPDKVCDLVSDAVLDAALTEDPNSRVACECYATTGLIVIGGEITTKSWIDFHKIARDTIRDIGYTKGDYRFDADSCGILLAVAHQSPDIAMGVDKGGAGDQGMMFGYACDETPEYMPASLVYAHKITKKLAEIRKAGGSLMKYLRPDGKSQVTVEYDVDGNVHRIQAIVVSVQHDPNVKQSKIYDDVVEHVVKKVIPTKLLDRKTKYHVNPTGRFEIGGPHGDTGLTGRKIIVDTYGGRAPHGGGAFSGKDPSKVDRSAAYACRHIAKNLVAGGFAKEVTIQVAYAIGVAEPVSFFVDTKGTGTVPDTLMARLISREIDMTPKGIIERLNLRRPIYKKTASYGHFGRREEEFTWEALDLIPLLKKTLR
ncbi:MAG TPA: methionine adenosyltransferase [Candidatus Kapabacteria bacterium]|nr:methionine adenosyltransferase [Candidatus Kapabacteria bacterium]